MADETAEPTTAAEATETQPTDWEAKYRSAIEHSREWERKAKANKGAADEVEKLKTSQMTDLEKAQREANEPAPGYTLDDSSLMRLISRRLDRGKSEADVFSAAERELGVRIEHLR